MEKLKKSWILFYSILWIFLTIFFFYFGEKGELYAYAFGRASDIFVSGLSLLIAILSFLFFRKRLRENKNRLLYIAIGTIVLPIAIGIFFSGINALIFSYWYHANF